MSRNENRALRGTVFTSFGKAVADSFGLSFSRSARDNCDTSCRLWTACYASRIERIYTALERKLGKHYRNGPIWVVNRALTQLPESPLRWARLSVDGSLPAKGKMSRKRWRSFVKRLRLLVSKATALGARWHIPVESMAKARSYRAALADLNVVIRRTSQANNVAQLLKSKDHCSWTVAKRIHGGGVRRTEVSENTRLAFEYATEIRSKGKTCVVCPAIAAKSLCGQCKACAMSSVDVVLYPFHP